MSSKAPRQDRSFATRIPGVRPLARLFERLMRTRSGFLVLLPIALALDVFDVFDELALGPVGMVLSFVLESAFLLGVTGRSSYAFGLAAVDLVPGLDVLPLATITLVRAYRRAHAGRAPQAAPGPIIDV